MESTLDDVNRNQSGLCPRLEAAGAIEYRLVSGHEGVQVRFGEGEDVRRHGPWSAGWTKLVNAGPRGWVSTSGGAELASVSPRLNDFLHCIWRLWGMRGNISACPYS